MKKLLFRNSFASRYKVGVKRKFISKQTTNRQSFHESAPVMVLDVDYFSMLLGSRKSYNSKETTLFYVTKWINAASTHVLPSGIIAVYTEPKTEYTDEILDCLATYNIPTQVFSTLPNFIYSTKIQGKLPVNLCIITNNLTTWAISNDSACLSFGAIDSNNRAIIYNNTTGLDFFCKFILTNKIINKLGLHHIKYLNLQYLYLLLLYINFTNLSPTEDFYFDNKYMLSLHKHSGKIFSRSNGLGLSQITQAHKFISYAFLTKPEFMDLFLLGSGTDYNLHLTRLKKLITFDTLILNKLHGFYKLHFNVCNQPILFPIIYNAGIESKELEYSAFFSSNLLPGVSLADHKEKVKKINRYLKRYPTHTPTQIIETLPEIYKKELKYSVGIVPETDDNISNDVDSYISTLLSDLFNG